MGYSIIDQATWPRAERFHFFRTYTQPHYATTVRLDITHLIMQRKPQGMSAYRACLFAIGAGLHAVPEFRMRFRGNEVRQFDSVELSVTVPTQTGGFVYAGLPFLQDFTRFDQKSERIIAETAQQTELSANTDRDDLAYLSCLPWIDYTATNNALPGPEDCIPRISWGKFTEDAPGQWRMAMTLEVHHALVDGAHVGAFFVAVQQTLNAL